MSYNPQGSPPQSTFLRISPPVSPNDSSLHAHKDYFAFIDLEMTGLDLEKDHILEMAVAITDRYLNILESSNFIIEQPLEILQNMNPWAMEKHNTPDAKTGMSLVEMCQNPEYSVSIKEAEEHACILLDKFRGKYKLYLAGSSVYIDKILIRKWMPMLDDRLHFRIVDVSSLLTLVKFWKPQILRLQPQNTVNHRAYQDILSSIELLRFYQKMLFSGNDYENNVLSALTGEEDRTPPIITQNYIPKIAIVKEPLIRSTERITRAKRIYKETSRIPENDESTRKKRTTNTVERILDAHMYSQQFPPLNRRIKGF